MCRSQIQSQLVKINSSSRSSRPLMS
jgi:hypothetical protein